MKSRKQIIVIVGILSLMLLSLFFIKYLPKINDLFIRPSLGDVIIENKACCFISKNITVVILSPQEVLTRLEFGELPYEGERKIKRINIDTEERVSVSLEIDYSYGEDGFANIPIASFDSIYDLKNSQMKLRFDEYETIYLTISFGESEIIYILDVDSNKWKIKT
ncbi:MAG: hypothetical protein ACOYWZ_00855 [Bacillota bacterium]